MRASQGHRIGATTPSAHTPEHLKLNFELTNNAGWAEATAALRATTQAAIDLGVTYVAGAVSKLLFEEDSGTCYGVILEDGSEIKASKIILATGANTAKIIADSAPHRKDIQVDDRITGAAVVTGAVRLNDAQMKHYGSMPVFIHRVGKLFHLVLSSCFVNVWRPPASVLSYIGPIQSRSLYRPMKVEV